MCIYCLASRKHYHVISVIRNDDGDILESRLAIDYPFLSIEAAKNFIHNDYEHYDIVDSNGRLVSYICD